MKKLIIPAGLLTGWTLSLAICLYLSFENSKLRADKIDTLKNDVLFQKLATLSLKKGEWEIFDLNDITFFRNQGKVDGKIEALIMMNKIDIPLEHEQINKIIEIAEKSTTDNLSANPQFLSLLCQAAFHKGISTAEEEKNEEYERGYHKAIDDITCPETGKVAIPPKKELDLTKPSN